MVNFGQIGVIRVLAICLETMVVHMKMHISYIIYEIFLPNK
jgi:hypothetical protein